MLITGWAILTPTDYALTAKHAFGASTFLSNVLFNREAGYFDSESHEKIFLHTWSLSVEWQFYIVFPVIVALFLRFCKKDRLFIFLSVIAILSFSFMLFMQDENPTANFYLLPGRAWEMLAGGLSYLFLKRRGGALGRLGWFVGCLLIVTSVTFIPSGSSWPQVLTLLPVVGTVLLICSDEKYSTYFNASWVQYIGRVSYSLYLWHWPIIAILYIYGLQNNPFCILIGLLLSFVLAHVSYALIEVPGARMLGKLKNFSVIGIGGLCTVVLFSFSAFIFFGKGIPNRMGAGYLENTVDMKMPFVNNGWCFYSVDSISSLEVGSEGTGCLLGEKGSGTKILLFGDSFAGQYEPFWDVVGKKWSVSIESIATNWCFPSFTENFIGPKSSRAYEQCLFNRAYVESNLDSYDLVVLAGSWAKVYEQGYYPDVKDLLVQLSMKKIPVVVMAAPMYFDKNPKKEYERTFVTGSYYDIEDFSVIADSPATSMHDLLSDLSAKLEGVYFWDRTFLFGGEQESSFFSADLVPFSLDGSHLSIYGSKQVADNFLRKNRCADVVLAIDSLSMLNCQSNDGGLVK